MYYDYLLFDYLLFGYSLFSYLPFGYLLIASYDFYYFCLILFKPFSSSSYYGKLILPFFLMVDYLQSGHLI
jgi:hypothetical protein